MGPYTGDVRTSPSAIPSRAVRVGRMVTQKRSALVGGIEQSCGLGEANRDARPREVGGDIAKT